MRGCRSISSLLIPAELEGRALELAIEVPDWRSGIKPQSSWSHQVGFPYNRYLLESHSQSCRFLKVSAVLYYLSCYTDLISAPLLPLSPSLGPGVGVVPHFQE